MSVSGVLVGVFYRQGKEERERGEGQRCHACEAAHWSSRAAGARESKGRRREKEEVDRGVAC